MPRLPIFLTLILTLCACAPQNLPVTPADWAGGITHTNGAVEPILVHFEKDGGTLTLQPRSDGFELRDVLHGESTLSFRTVGAKELAFNGRFEAGRVEGNVT